MQHMEIKMSKSELWVIATPIGNLGDMTFRAVEALKEADILLAEDTRVTQKLLRHFSIGHKVLLSHYKDNERFRADQILQQMEQAELSGVGLKVALISDAGTPCLSDPGTYMIEHAHERGIKVVPIPGASALSTLASVSGFFQERLCFVGFLPSKPSPLRTTIEDWAGLGQKTSVVFFSRIDRLKSIFRVIETLYPSALLCIGRELTKLHEEVKRMGISEALLWVDTHPCLKGEVCVLVYLVDAQSGMQPSHPVMSLEDITEWVQAKRLEQPELRFRDVWESLKGTGHARGNLYKHLLTLFQE